MSDNGTNTATRNRREFLTGTVIAGGAAAVASVIPGDASAARREADSGHDRPLADAESDAGFLALPDDSPIVMVNLMKFKPERRTSGVRQVRGRCAADSGKVRRETLVFRQGQFCLIGQADWDVVALVQYPRKKTLLQMSISPEYRAIHHHREAGLQGQINYAVVPIDPAANAAIGAVGAAEIRPGVLAHSGRAVRQPAWIRIQAALQGDWRLSRCTI